MPTDFDNHLLRQAIIHYKVGEFDTAARYLTRALDLADDYDTKLWGNYYAAQLAHDPVIKRRHLDAVLSLDPSHPEARKALAILDGKLRPEEIVNPDALPAQSDETITAQADRFTCPKCGGRMIFAPDGRTLTCEYCTRNQTVSNELQQGEQDFVLAMATGKGHRKAVAMQTFYCKGCGANFLLAPTEKTATCAYCGSAYVVQGESRQLIEPDSIIPMALDQRQAMQSIGEWAARNKIQPDGKAKSPRGMYLPVWTFDITGPIPWNGTIHRNKHTYQVSGIEMLLANDVAVPATRRLGKQLKHFLAGYEFSVVTAYDPGYLAGWSAEVPEIAMSDASLEARQTATKEIPIRIERLNRNIHNLSYNTVSISVMSFKLVFIPLWMTEYTLEGETYHVLVNGATGAVHGQKPAGGILGWLESLIS